MCHGNIDPNILMRDAEDRLRAAQPAAQEPSQVHDGIPPELIGGVRGVWARIAAVFARRKPVPFAAE